MGALRKLAVWLGLMVLAWPSAPFAQTFVSGSTGVDGAYAPSCAPTPCTVTLPLPADGVFNYTTIIIPSGVTVKYTRNAANTPVTLLATGDVTISGTIDVSGEDGLAPVSNGSAVLAGGLGGPGGFNGGNGGYTTDIGTSYGGPAPVPPPTAGQGPGGGTTDSRPIGAGVYGVSASFVSLAPLFGGSGGAGGPAEYGPVAAGSGAGGGGAIVIASSTSITVASGGTIAATGGSHQPHGCAGNHGHDGSGGAIRLVAPQILGSGTIRAALGSFDYTCSFAGDGKIRLEAFTQGFAGTAQPRPSLSIAPAPVTAAGTPALVALPMLRIAAIGGVAAPATPGGSHTAEDISLNPGTTNPVTVTIAARNLPVGPATTIQLRLITQAGDTTLTVPSSNHAGTFAGSTATTTVTLPVGQVSVLQAIATTTLTGQLSGLFPAIDGEPAERVTVAFEAGASTLRLVTKAGREKRFDELAREEQIRVALAWETMKGDR